MAIDPKELRIGSHIDVNGVRARVTKIDEPKSNEIPPYVILCFTAVIDGELREAGGFPHDDKINPIPITPELLTELGFCKKMFDSNWSMWTKDVDSFSISVGIQNSECKGVEIKDNDDKDVMFGWSFPCKYLHEMESFYYHCTKQELIND